MLESPLSCLTPEPEPWPLPLRYPRHDPSPHDLRLAIDCLADQQDWPGLSWTGLVEALLRLGCTDIPLGRLVEGHVDALRILAQAGATPHRGARYGVWASRSAGTGVRGRRTSDGGVRLDGVIRFASGAGIVDRALVPVWLDADSHLLVDLAVDALPVDTSHWQTAAMRVSQTHTVTVTDVVVPADQQVGAVGFYLGRDEFLPGGVGVAAVWAGGLTRVLDVTVAMLAGRTAAPAQQARLGRARLHLVSALTVVRAAGVRLDAVLVADPGRRSDPVVVAAVCTETRAAVAQSVVAALAEVRSLAGPAGLAFDPDLGHALDDLGLYAAQLNADAEATRLGSDLGAST